MDSYFKAFFLGLAIIFQLQAIINAHPTSSEEAKMPNLPRTNLNFQDSSQEITQLACNLSSSLILEIQNYHAIASLIFSTVLNGSFKGRTYNEIGRFVDKHVNRLTGSQGLEDSIDYMMDKMKEDGLENVRAEPVIVPHWIRGEERAEITEPINKKLNILGLGSSGGTPAAGLSAGVVVVQSFQDLDDKSNLIPGKIVVYNQGWLGSYGSTNAYRGDGPNRAARYGAVAALVESVTPYSLDTPHTGQTVFGANDTVIPAGSMTREDAELLSRLYNRGENITIHLTMLNEILEPVSSRNAFGEIVGRQLPDEIVAVSGHIDAWDVGQGAMDDAGGVMISVEALALIKSLGLVPRRTLQAILWTAEEFGLIGVQSFVNEHRSEMGKYNAVFESDGGTFKPLGLDFAGSAEAGCIVEEILKLAAPINATMFRQFPSVSSDISFMIDEGVPGLDLNNENDYYFYYHHSKADMLTVLDPTELDLDTALWAVVSYVLADLSVPLPR